MVYCTAQDVRKICQIDTDDLTSTELTTLITYATAQLNKDIGFDIVEEKADYIDTYRQNKRDGSNTIFYVQDSRTHYIGDRDDDGVVGITDVRVYVYDSSAQTITEATVSAVDFETGGITVSSAPAAGTTVTITYRRFPIDVSTPALSVKTACMYLAAAMAYMNIRGEDFPKLRLGDLAIDSYKKLGDMTFQSYLMEYARQVNLILSSALRKDNSIIIPPYMQTYDGEPI